MRQILLLFETKGVLDASNRRKDLTQALNSTPALPTPPPQSSFSGGMFNLRRLTKLAPAARRGSTGLGGQAPSARRGSRGFAMVTTEVREAFERDGPPPPPPPTPPPYANLTHAHTRTHAHTHTRTHTHTHTYYVYTHAHTHTRMHGIQASRRWAATRWSPRT